MLDRRAAGLLALLCALFALGASGRARAWTDASIEGASAHLDVEPGGRARVHLTLALRVHGGWISRLELAGLDSDLVLDPDKPASLLAEDGQKLAPDIKVGKNGRVLLTFPTRARAPHRGRHSLELSYVTHLAPTENGGERALRWAMPPFRMDLRDVDVWINAPASAQALPPDDGAVRVTRYAAGSRSVLHWERAQLPRTLAFEAGFSLPNVASTGEGTPRAGHQPSSLPHPAWAMLIVLLLCALKRAAVRAQGRAASARTLPLIALSSPLRAIAMLGLAGFAGFGHAAYPSGALFALIALCALAIDRGFAPRPSAAVRVTRALLVATHRRARWARIERLFGLPAWLDATTPLGAPLLLSCYVVVGLHIAGGAGIDIWAEALLAATPLWLSATRFALPPSAHERLLSRVREAQRSRARALQAAHAAASPGAPAAGGPDAEAFSPVSPVSPVSPRAGADRRAPGRAA